MKNINLTTVVLGLAVGFVVYKVVSGRKKETETTSAFSSACGCGA
jgi:hypothetical protein